MEKRRSWKHSGFSVHCGKPIEACDDNGRKTLSEYISRAPFSLERMSFNEDSKTVVYRGEHFHPTLARNFDVAEPLEWIARITAHIPKKGAKQLIRRILKHLDLWEEPRPPPIPLEMVCEPDVDYVPWQDDVPEIEVG